MVQIPAGRFLMGFRMALLSGEVETRTMKRPRAGVELVIGSGWLCYPGKLKLDQPHQIRSFTGLCSSGWLCYPGKLKQQTHQEQGRNLVLFRMALLSGEVETRASAA